jgi:hypothetical protein
MISRNDGGSGVVGGKLLRFRVVIFIDQELYVIRIRSKDKGFLFIIISSTCTYFNIRDILLSPIGFSRSDLKLNKIDTTNLEYCQHKILCLYISKFTSILEGNSRHLKLLAVRLFNLKSIIMLFCNRYIRQDQRNFTFSCKHYGESCF